jgi:hypothetical protein
MERIDHRLELHASVISTAEAEHRNDRLLRSMFA